MYIITKEEVMELERIFRSLSFVPMRYDDKQQVSKGLIILRDVQERPKEVIKKEELESLTNHHM